MDSRGSMTDRRVRAMLGRLKGETLAALENVHKTSGDVLNYLRDGGSIRLPGDLSSRLHTSQAGLHKAVSAQQRARAIDDVLTACGMTWCEAVPQEDDDE